MGCFSSFAMKRDACFQFIYGIAELWTKKYRSLILIRCSIGFLRIYCAEYSILHNPAIPNFHCPIKLFKWSSIKNIISLNRKHSCELIFTSRSVVELYKKRNIHTHSRKFHFSIKVVTQFMCIIIIELAFCYEKNWNMESPSPRVVNEHEYIIIYEDKSSSETPAWTAAACRIQAGWDSKSSILPRHIFVTQKSSGHRPLLLITMT